jgi:hypothetical protein
MPIRTAIRALGHLDTVYDLYRTKQVAGRILDHYESYPERPGEFDRWQRRRDELMEDVYATTGADPKY